MLPDQSIHLEDRHQHCKDYAHDEETHHNNEQGAEEPEALRQLMYDEVLERVERDGDLIADLP